MLRICLLKLQFVVTVFSTPLLEIAPFKALSLRTYVVAGSAPGITVDVPVTVPKATKAPAWFFTSSE